MIQNNYIITDYMNKMMKKLCLIFNSAPHYREAIFSAIDAEYECDWFFCEAKTDIKEMDTSLLNSVQYFKTTGNPNIMYWKKGMLRLLFKKKYQNFLMLAEVRSLTDWVFFWLANTFFPKKRVYIWTHGWYGKESGLKAQMKLWLFRHVSGTFVYGVRAKRLLVEKRVPENKLFVIYNSLDYAKQKELRERMRPSDVYTNHFHNNFPTIIFIGRLTKVKKLDMVIDSLMMLKKSGKIYNLVFVGDGVEMENLTQRVIKLQIEKNVWFYGACYDERKNAELVYNADLCVSPGNVGLTAMHALVFGCPVITHNDFDWQMPEFEAIKQNVTGDFFKKDDVKDLVATISRWFATKQKQREEVRKACFEEIDTNWNPNYQMGVIRKNLNLL